MNAIFHLPEFFDYKEVYRRLFILKDLCPNIFLDNTEIGSIYGNFHGSIWNGGTYSKKMELLTRSQIEQIINYYNHNLEIPLAFTFTNPCIEKEDCFDKYSNLIAEVGHNGMNIIRVASPILEDYLREKYPNYKYSSSVIMTENQPYGDLKKYDSAVVRRIFNNNWLFLNNIACEDRGKLEFICNESCPADCSNMYNHYKAYGEYTLSYFNVKKAADTICVNYDPSRMFFPYFYGENSKWFISRKAIDTEYLPRGFQNFKITGRWASGGIAYAILRYLIKPEYIPDVINRCFIMYPGNFDDLLKTMYNIEREKARREELKS